MLILQIMICRHLQHMDRRSGTPRFLTPCRRVTTQGDQSFESARILVRNVHCLYDCLMSLVTCSKGRIFANSIQPQIEAARAGGRLCKLLVGRSPRGRLKIHSDLGGKLSRGRQACLAGSAVSHAHHTRTFCRFTLDQRRKAVNALGGHF